MRSLGINIFTVITYSVIKWKGASAGGSRVYVCVCVWDEKRQKQTVNQSRLLKCRSRALWQNIHQRNIYSTHRARRRARARVYRYKTYTHKSPGAQTAKERHTLPASVNIASLGRGASCNWIKLLMASLQSQFNALKAKRTNREREKERHTHKQNDLVKGKRQRKQNRLYICYYILFSLMRERAARDLRAIPRRGNSLCDMRLYRLYAGNRYYLIPLEIARPQCRKALSLLLYIAMGKSIVSTCSILQSKF